MTNSNLDAVLSVIGKVNSRLAQSPEGAAVFARVRAGEITVDQAVVELVEMAEAEGILGDLAQASGAIKALAPTFEVDLHSLQDEKRPVMTETSTGIPQLNPLYEAAITERAGLDGDVPELRFGPFPLGATPAIPVETDSLDPVVVGMMLEKASDRVLGKLEDAREDHAALQDQLLLEAHQKAKEEGLDPGTAVELARQSLPSVPTGVEGYRAGERPHPVKVLDVDVHAVATLTPSERQKRTYKVLSSTQGRASLTPPIRKRVLALLDPILKRRGIGFVEGVPGDDWVQGTWVLRVWGAEDISDNFNFANVAAGVLANQLAQQISEGFPWSEVALEITPHDGISERLFGWTARLGPVGEES